jgi:hypothetical protein
LYIYANLRVKNEKNDENPVTRYKKGTDLRRRLKHFEKSSDTVPLGLEVVLDDLEALPEGDLIY